MNNANSSEDRVAAEGSRQPANGELAAAPFSARPDVRRWRALVLLMAAISPLAACSGMPEQRAHDIADRRAEWLDRFTVDQRSCAAAGGVIVQERHEPQPIRVGGSGPEIGTRYYCRY